MKEMGETIFPSYKVGLFLVELPCGTWQALEKDSFVRLTDLPKFVASRNFLTTGTYPTRRWREGDRIPRW